MAKWYVNELSKLTKISVRTLHHYDKLGLLQPSLRLPNGYRLYSEADLLKLQKIIALKFFGFELADIKKLLDQAMPEMDHFLAQSRLLQKKAEALLEANRALTRIIDVCRQDKSIPWENIIELIEVYRMTEQLEKTWVGDVFNAEELKAYANFEQHLKTRLHEKEAFEAAWRNIVKEVTEHLTDDPASEIGIRIAKQCMDLINGLYGKQYAALRTALWEKGFKQGKIGMEHGLSLDSVNWLDKAMDAYYQQRIDQLFAKIETHSSDSVFGEWQTLLEEMYGDAVEPKQAFFDAIMSNNKVSVSIKKWLEDNKKSIIG